VPEQPVPVTVLFASVLPEPVLLEIVWSGGKKCSAVGLMATESADPSSPL